MSAPIEPETTGEAVTRTTFCRICEALCGLEATVQGDRVVALKPDDKHVATAGFACKKGLGQLPLYDSPDRLRRPLKRDGDRYVPISWEQALSEIGEKVKRLRGVHPRAVAMYVGTAAGFSVLHPIFAQGFMQGIGSNNLYSTATQDCSNKFAVAREMYGFPFTQPFPDVEHTRCLIVVGANPVVSKWSFLQVPNPPATLKAIEHRGGSVWVVDPRRTETAKVAGRHVFIKPGSDVFFYAAFLAELIRRGGVDERVVAAHLRGFDEVAALVAPWTLERAEAATGIAPSVMAEMVADYLGLDAEGRPIPGADSIGSALYSSTGVNMGGHGGLAFWLQETINAVSGNLDRRGGTLVGEGIVDFPAFGKRTGTLMSRARSRVGDFGAVNDAFPGGLLADEILTPGPEQIRALFVTGGNPLITMPNSGRLADAFASIELLVCLDVVQSETASMAHYVLPTTGPFERPDLPFIFPLWLGLQKTPYLQATEALVSPPGEARDEATIYLGLCRAAGVSIFGSRVAQWSLERATKTVPRKGGPAQPRVNQEALLSLLLRLGRQGSFKTLLKDHHGRRRPAHRDTSFLGRRVLTDDRRVNVAPAAFLAEARKLDADYDRFLADASDGRLRLITRRHITTHNSWTHNHPDWVAGPDKDTNHLYLHPRDAAERGLVEGELVDVSSDVTTVRLPMKLLPELQPGVCALPHGWGHQRARGLSIASKTRGVNVNLLAGDGPDRLERNTGMARLTAIPVTVTRAAGPQNAASWSGI